jgi:hypothetical protein
VTDQGSNSANWEEKLKRILTWKKKEREKKKRKEKEKEKKQGKTGPFLSEFMFLKTKTATISNVIGAQTSTFWRQWFEWKSNKNNKQTNKN